MADLALLTLLRKENGYGADVSNQFAPNQVMTKPVWGRLGQVCMDFSSTNSVSP